MSQNQDVLAEIKNAALSESPPPRPSTKPTLLDVDSQDPDLRLRVVRSARESIRFAAQEDERRQIGKRRRRRDNLQSFFGSFKRGRSSSSASASEKAGSFLRPNSQPPAQNHRASFFQEEQTAKAENFVEAKPEDGAPQKGAESRRRRTVNVNVALSALELDHRAQPLARYARNKVKTSKYSILTFIPKNLGLQFTRAANVYFLALVVLQSFDMFGGSGPIVAMIPLLAILVVTGLKDAIEDYRRHALDNEVNNSAATRLGGWRNVNQPTDDRNLLQRLLGLSPPDQRVSKGVRKLRQREGEFSTDFLKNNSSYSFSDKPEINEDPLKKLPYQGSEQQFQIQIHRDDPSDTAEALQDSQSVYASSEGGDKPIPFGRTRSYTLGGSTIAPSARAGTGELGVVDYSRQAPGTAFWERTLWKKIEVGDIVLLKENEAIPADMVVLSTSDQDGACFVETKNLDGETNLKPRRSLRSTMGIQSEEDIEHAKFVLDSEPPHANLYSYSATLRYWKRDTKGVPGAEQKEGVTINELLLRGCALRNTAWVIGLVVYTGADTKIMLNQGETPSKRSKVEREINFNVLVMFIMVVAMCLSSAIADGYFKGKVVTSSDFYELGNDGSSIILVASLITFGATLVCYQNVVPIALILSIELVKSIQAYFIYSDLDMYYEPIDYPCVPKNWNISDDLGQIEYIFSDKTGTLTQNVMEFMKCSINGSVYGEGVTEASKGAAKRDRKGDTSAFTKAPTDSQLLNMKDKMIAELQRLFKNPLMQSDQLTLIAPQLASDMGDRSSSQRAHIIDFFRALALCHTVLADRSDTTQPDLIKYKAESPDEAALVSAARDVGFAFLARTSLEVDIEVMGQRERWTPLRTLEFNSTRKRMSVIVRSPDNRLLLICKGADSVIYKRLRADHDKYLQDKTSQDLETFANGGLRTLCIAQRYLTERDFAEWSRAFDAACSASEDREEEMEKACELIEQDLTLIGATALEDKLQVGVPEAIERLHQASIKLWILTGLSTIFLSVDTLTPVLKGDRLQTAVEIGFSCNLLKPSMDILIISADSAVGARAQIESGLAKVHANLATARAGGQSTEHAVVIDGETLRSALADDLKALFLELTVECETVICCRVSPAQKANVVKLVKEGKNAMTLAIGDGANDVAMIQEANVGIGIAGLEGAQASMSADYAVGQFRFLEKLLLVHGRWCYKRIALFCAVFFYKSIVWTFPLFWFQFFCAFNASIVMDYSYLMLFSILFTCLPVILLGAFDQDVDAKTSLLYPILYKRGIAGLEYTRTVFFSFVVDGLYQSAICFFVPYLTYSISTTQSVTGVSTDGMAELGTVIAISAVLATNCYTAMLTRYWTKLFVIITALSSLSVILWTAIYSIFPFSLLGIVVQLFSTAPFYLTVIVTVIFCLLPRFAWMYTQGCYWPTEVDIIREKRLAGNPDDSGQRKAGDDLPSAIALPLSPPESATRTPSYFSSVPPPTGTPTGQTPETRSPLYSTFTPPQSLTPPMQQELWHSPSSQWDSPQENFSENTEERHRSSVYLSPDSSLSQQPSTQSFRSFHSDKSPDGPASPAHAV